MSTALMGKMSTPADIEARRRKIESAQSEGTLIRICLGSNCIEKGSQKIYELFSARAEDSRKEGRIRITNKCVGCHGLCDYGPIVVIEPQGILYCQVNEKDIEEIFSETLMEGRAVERLLYKDPVSGQRILTREENPFLKFQKRRVLSSNGMIDPGSFDDYLLTGGYRALANVLDTMSPEEVIEGVEGANLRGCGGAGFSTAEKWQLCRAASGEHKYAICNGDEGDPETIKDRSIMEGNPHLVIEGLILAGYATGAAEGFIYIRNDYTIAIKNLGKAVEDARSCGLLGEGILGSDFCFDIAIHRGGGNFVCGESTALISALEGRVGEPKAKYPRNTTSGFRAGPTVINNVETLAFVPSILAANNGSQKRNNHKNAEKSMFTKVVQLSGGVNRPGIAEVRIGTPLREIIDEIGGGTPKKKQVKAIRIGGPSGGFIPADELDTPLDFDGLLETGSIMGSSGIRIMDEDACMVTAARSALSFLKDESCGKCTACREGTAQAVNLLERICSGKGDRGDLELLENLAGILEDASLCGLGRTAANPLRTTLRFFPDEFREHIDEKYCSAGECKGLFMFEIDPETCTGCGVCKKACPVTAISGERKAAHLIDQTICTSCNTCYEKCRFSAIFKVKKRELVEQ